MKKICLLNVLFFALSTTAYAQEKAPEPEAEAPSQSAEDKGTEAPNSSDDIRAELDALRKEVAELRHEVEENEEGHESEAEDAHDDGEHEDEELDDHDDGDGDEHADEGKKKFWVPMFSMMGDFYAQYAYHDDEVYSSKNRTGFYFRNLEIAVQSEIADDVYALIALHMTNEELHLESGYVYWSNVTPWLGLTFGVFREKFGRNNEIHSPEMNQFDRPVVIREYLGDEGMIATGFAMTFRLPKYKSYSAVIDLQIANGTDANLFSGEFFNPAPTGVIHLANKWEKERTEVNFGLSGMFGANNNWGELSESGGTYVLVDENPVDENGDPVLDEDGNPVVYIEEAEVEMEEGKPVNDDDWRLTAMAAMDLTVGWRYGPELKRNVLWQSEYMYIFKEAYDAHEGEKGEIHAMGAYSYLQWRFIKNLAVGVRGDVVQPLDFDNEDRLTWGVTPYITWYQNSHLRIRAQYSYTDWAQGPESHAEHDHGHGGERVVGVEHLAILQVTFAIGEGDLGAETPQRVRGGAFHAH